MDSAYCFHVTVTGADPGRMRALRLLVSRFELAGGTLRIALDGQTPEEVLAACRAVGLGVGASRVLDARLALRPGRAGERA